jgi:formate-dependent nitrite reductase membrane component NrfD
MSTSDVTKEGIKGAQPGRDAMVGVVAGRHDGRRQRRGRGEQSMVPDATFSSYYGKPVLNPPIWKAPDIAGYFFLGGLSGAASVIGACASATGRPSLAKASKVGALVSIGLGMVGLVHDLGKPSRFVNMLRVFKPTSPMSVGSWALAGYGPAVGTAALTAVTGRLTGVGAVATGTAAALGPFISAYTAALMCNTAVPSWHEAYREMPFVFVGSSATAAGGLGMIGAPVAEAGPARKAALFGAMLEMAAAQTLTRRLGHPLAEPYQKGKSGTLLKASEALTALGSIGSVVLGRRSRAAAMASGAALIAGSALSRFAIFEAGMVSAKDPEHTVRPQRERLDARAAAE